MGTHVIGRGRYARQTYPSRGFNQGGVFGRDYQRIDSDPAFTVGAGLPSPTTFVTKPGAVLTTPALTGLYRIKWQAIINTSAANVNGQVRLLNVTDAVTVGGVQNFEPSTGAGSVDMEDMSASRNITFTGASKQFDVQISKLLGPNAGSTTIQFVSIELWKVAT